MNKFRWDDVLAVFFEFAVLDQPDAFADRFIQVRGGDDDLFVSEKDRQSVFIRPIVLP